MNIYLLSQLPLILGFTALLILAALRPWGKENISSGISVLAFLASAFLIWTGFEAGMEFFGGAIRITALGKVLACLCLGLSAIAIVLTDAYLEKVHIHPVDWKMVVMAATLGMVSLSFAGDLATLFIAYELVSIPSYVLCGFSSKDPRSNEAGMKYLILGAFTSAILLLGISFLYGATGQIHLAAIQETLTSLSIEASTGMGAGVRAASDLLFARMALGFILAAIFFKVAIVPFHSWLPDVYQGTNLASLSIIAAPVKIAVFGMLAALLWGPFAALSGYWQPVLMAGVVLSVIVAGLQAATQSNLKRILAYSAIVNAGFILLGILSGSVAAFLVYLGAYGIMTMGALAAFMAMGTPRADVDEMPDLVGIGKSHKWLAMAMTVILFSYAGIPLTAGFAAKFGVMLESIRSSSELPSLMMPVLLIAVTGSLISFYIYFQMVKAIWIQEPQKGHPILLRDFRWSYLLVLGLSVLLILGFGLFIPIPGI